MRPDYGVPRRNAQAWVENIEIETRMEHLADTSEEVEAFQIWRRGSRRLQLGSRHRYCDGGRNRRRPRGLSMDVCEE